MDVPTPITPGAERGRQKSASELLTELSAHFPNEKVTVGELVDRLEGHAIGLFLLLLALPMCIPNLPGISTIFGVLMLAPAIQLTLGSKHLWLPGFMRNWTFPREGLRKAVKISAPTLRRFEWVFRPRLQALTQFPFTVFFGLQTVLLAIVLIIPIPGGNWPPAITISIMSLALMQRDGALAIVSTLCAAISTIAAYYFFYFGIVALNWFSAWFTGLF